MPYAFGDAVIVQQDDGEHSGWIVLEGPVRGPEGTPVVWVCDADEWAISEREGRDPRGTPVPAGRVRAFGPGLT